MLPDGIHGNFIQESCSLEVGSSVHKVEYALSLDVHDVQDHFTVEDDVFIRDGNLDDIRLRGHEFAFLASVVYFLQHSSGTFVDFVGLDSFLASVVYFLQHSSGIQVANSTVTEAVVELGKVLLRVKAFGVEVPAQP